MPEECAHRSYRAHRGPYRLLCDDCGRELYHRGYADTPPRPPEPDLRTPEQRKHDGWMPPWPGTGTEPQPLRARSSIDAARALEVLGPEVSA